MRVLTVNKETGCGNDVLEIISKTLNYRTIDKEIFQYAATLSNTNPEKAKKLDDRQFSSMSNLIANYFELDLFGTETPSAPPKKYKPYTQMPFSDGFQPTVDKVIRMFANEGNSIIVGRGGNFLLKDFPNALHVRFIAPLEMRIQNIMNSENMTREEAEDIAKNTDANKKKYVSKFFNADIADPINYQIVINLGKVKAERVAELLIKALTYDEKK